MNNLSLLVDEIEMCMEHLEGVIQETPTGLRRTELIAADSLLSAAFTAVSLVASLKTETGFDSCAKAVTTWERCVSAKAAVERGT